MTAQMRVLALLVMMTIWLTGCAGATATALGVPAALQSRADHEAAALRYEEEAKAASERVAAHRRMLLLYAAPYPDYSVSGLVGHCQNMISRYVAIEKDALDMAAIHRRLAAGLP